MDRTKKEKASAPPSSSAIIRRFERNFLPGSIGLVEKPMMDENAGQVIGTFHYDFEAGVENFTRALKP